MRRGRRLGRAGVMDQARRREVLAKRGEQLSAERARQMKVQLEAFKQKLERFAIQHKDEIQRDAAFRAKFHAMCSSIGVDPLTSRKGKWAELLGVGNFYYELGVRVIEVCVSTRSINGGIIAVPQLIQLLKRRRITYTEDISPDDIEKAVSKLSVLGNGFKIFEAGSQKMVQSIPLELSPDHTTALGKCKENGFLTHSLLKDATNWSSERVKHTLQFLLRNEFAWVDRQTDEEAFWIVGLSTQFRTSESASAV